MHYERCRHENLLNCLPLPSYVGRHRRSATPPGKYSKNPAIGGIRTHNLEVYNALLKSLPIWSALKQLAGIIIYLHIHRVINRHMCVCVCAGLMVVELSGHYRKKQFIVMMFGNHNG